MVESTDTGQAELAFIVLPTGSLMLLVSVPNLEPFKKMWPEAGIWIRWQAPSQEDRTSTRLEIVMRRPPYTTGATPKVVARSAPIGHAQMPMLELAAIQSVVDLCAIEQRALKSSQCKSFEHYIAVVEPPSYDWNRYQALCEQFEAERRGRASRRNSHRAHERRKSRLANESIETTPKLMAKAT